MNIYEDINRYFEKTFQADRGTNEGLTKKKKRGLREARGSESIPAEIGKYYQMISKKAFADASGDSLDDVVDAEEIARIAPGFKLLGYLQATSAYEDALGDNGEDLAFLVTDESGVVGAYTIVGGDLIPIDTSIYEESLKHSSGKRMRSREKGLRGRLEKRLKESIGTRKNLREDKDESGAGSEYDDDYEQAFLDALDVVMERHPDSELVFDTSVRGGQGSISLIDQETGYETSWDTSDEEAEFYVDAATADSYDDLVERLADWLDTKYGEMKPGTDSESSSSSSVTDSERVKFDRDNTEDSDEAVREIEKVLNGTTFKTGIVEIDRTIKRLQARGEFVRVGTRDLKHLESAYVHPIRLQPLSEQEYGWAQAEESPEKYTIYINSGKKWSVAYPVVLKNVPPKQYLKAAKQLMEQIYNIAKSTALKYGQRVWRRADDTIDPYYYISEETERRFFDNESFKYGRSGKKRLKEAEHYNIDDLHFIYTVRKLDEDGDVVDDVRSFKNKEDAIKWAKTRNYFVDVCSDVEEELNYNDLLELENIGKIYDVVWTNYESLGDVLKRTIPKNRAELLSYIEQNLKNSGDYYDDHGSAKDIAYYEFVEGGGIDIIIPDAYVLSEGGDPDNVSDDIVDDYFDELWDNRLKKKIEDLLKKYSRK